MDASWDLRSMTPLFDKEQDVMTLEEVEDMGMLIFHKRDLQMGGRF